MLIACRKTILNFALAKQIDMRRRNTVRRLLAENFPLVSVGKLDRIHAVSREARSFGYKLMGELVEQYGIAGPLRASFFERYRQQYPWVSDKNLGAFYAHWMYIEMK